MTSKLLSINSDLRLKTVDSKMEEVLEAALSDKPLERLTAFFDFQKIACRTRGHYLPRQLQARLLEICTLEDPLERTGKIQAAFRVQFPPKVENVVRGDWRKSEWIQQMAMGSGFTEEDKKNLVLIRAGKYDILLIGEIHDTKVSFACKRILTPLAKQKKIILFHEIPRNPQDELSYRRLHATEDEGLLFGLEDPIDHTLSILHETVHFLVCHPTILNGAFSPPADLMTNLQITRLYPIFTVAQLCGAINCKEHLRDLWKTIESETGISKASPLYTTVDKALAVKDPGDFSEYCTSLEPLFRQHTKDELIVLFKELTLFAQKKYAQLYTESQLQTLKSNIEAPESEEARALFKKFLHARRDKHFAKVLVSDSLDAPKDLVRVAVMGRYHLSGTLAALEEVFSGKAAPVEGKADAKGSSSKTTKTEYKGAGEKKA